MCCCSLLPRWQHVLRRARLSNCASRVAGRFDPVDHRLSVARCGACDGRTRFVLSRELMQTRLAMNLARRGMSHGLAKIAEYLQALHEIEANLQMPTSWTASRTRPLFRTLRACLPRTGNIVFR